MARTARRGLSADAGTAAAQPRAVEDDATASATPPQPGQDISAPHDAHEPTTPEAGASEQTREIGEASEIGETGETGQTGDAGVADEVPPGEQITVTAVDPAEIGQDLANRLAALDRSEMVASGRNLAVVDARALLTKLQTLSALVLVAGPLDRPVAWATVTTPAEGAVLHGTVSSRDRRKGVGDRLLAEVLAYANEHDYRTITCTVWTETSGEGFLLRHGFEAHPYASVVRCQDLYATAERRRRIGEDTAGYGASYELITSEEELEQGGSLFRVVASHLITGVEVGSAELTVTEGAPEFAINGMVQVDERHRGTRLGTLMAIDLIGLVQAKARKVRIVQVCSPAADPYVTTILDRLGFRVAGVQVEHRLRLR